MTTLAKIGIVGLIGILFSGAVVMRLRQTKAAAASMSASPSTHKVIHHVVLTAKGAEPSDLLIKVGEYIEFDSKDGQTHDIASGAGDGDGEHHAHSATGLESGDFKGDEGYLVQFNSTGSYFFHDHLHPTLTISVAVYQPSASSTVNN